MLNIANFIFMNNTPTISGISVALEDEKEVDLTSSTIETKWKRSTCKLARVRQFLVLKRQNSDFFPTNYP